MSGYVEDLATALLILAAWPVGLAVGAWIDRPAARRWRAERARMFPTPIRREPFDRTVVLHVHVPRHAAEPSAGQSGDSGTEVA